MPLSRSLAILVFTLGFVLANHSLNAQTYTDLHDYNANTGDPSELLNTGNIPQGRDGNLYGISHFAGTSGIGSVFVTDPTTGTPTIIASFDTTTGAYPYNGLTFGSDGNFYGTTPIYGTGGAGTVYKVTPAGAITILHAFANTGDGGWPSAPPVVGNDGNYYGLASGNDQGTQFPSVFYKVSTSGTFTAIHTFNTTTEGTQCSAIVLGSDGNFWGGCNLGGANSLGTLFKITPAGVVTVLHTFTGTDGSSAATAMVEGKDGNYYGVAAAGGSGNAGVLFQLKPTGAYTILHPFTNGADGGYPMAPLTVGSDSNIYGTTANGGNVTACPNGIVGCGTIFSVTTAGKFKTLYTFNNTTGAYPESALTQRTDGSFYGNTLAGGANNAGVFYRFSTNLQPFISLESTSGKVGSKVEILGQGFSASSVVKFNGVQATSVMLSGTTYISATVPTGASSGTVTVTTGSTTLTSLQKYTVHNSWSAGAPMPSATWSPVGVGVLGGNIYFVGGRTSSGVTTNAVEIYNPTTNTWSTGTPLPTPTAEGNAAVVNNVLYVFGGSSETSTCNGSVTNAVWAYAASTKTWTAKAAMPTARCDAGVGVVNGIIYVVGGFDGTNPIATVESYNPSTNSWTEEAPLLGIKNGPEVGVLGTSIVAAGGYLGNGFTGDTESYSPTKNSWSELTADTTLRNAACYGTVNSSLYVAGGNNTSGATNVTELFSLSANKWTTLLAEPTAVLYAGSAVSAGQLYCIGGSLSYLGTAVTNVQIYQP